MAGDAKLFETWHDTMLDIDCSFAFDTAGVKRCLPTSLGFIAFSDANCTAPVGIVTATDRLGSYVTAGASSPCSAGSPFLQSGSVIEVPMLYEQTGAACQLMSALPASLVTTAVGAPVRDDTFVAEAETITEKRDQRLSARVRVASDGSREVMTFFDLKRVTECSLTDDPTHDSHACVPNGIAYVQDYFSDAQCTLPAAYGADDALGCFGPPRFAETVGVPERKYFELGKPLTAQAYEGMPASCLPVVPDPSFPETFYAVGAPAPWSSFPALTVANEGSGRIQISTLRSASGVLLASLTFYDRELNVPCTAGLTADAGMRCVPGSALQTDVFTDDACTSPVYIPAIGLPLPEQGDLLEVDVPNPSQPRLIARLGPQIDAQPPLWQLAGGHCAAIPAAEGGVYDAILVSSDGFAPITREVE